MSFIQIEFNDGFLINSYQTDPNLFIINASLNRQITELYGSLNMSIALPTKDLKTRFDVLNRIKRQTNVKIYQYSDNLFTKDKNLLMDGIVENLTISPDNISVIFYDKTYLLSKACLKTGYQVLSQNFVVELNRLLTTHGFDKIVDKIIYPTRQNIMLKSDTNLVPGDQETCMAFLNRMCNDIQMYITTIYIDNKCCLYCLDTAEILQAKYKPFDIFINTQTSDSRIIDYEITCDFSHISDKITINARADILNQDMGAINSYTRNDFDVDAYTENRFASNSQPPVLFTTQIKTDINAFDMTDYAKYVFKKQIHSAIRISVSMPGLYPNLNDKSEGWNIGIVANIPKENNLIYSDLKVNFGDVLQSMFNNEFIVAGFEMKYDQNNSYTAIEIVPSNFLKY